MGGFVVTIAWKTVFSADGDVIKLEKCRFLVIFLNCNGGYVVHGPHMAYGNTVMPLEIFGSSGTHLLYNLEEFVCHRRKTVNRASVHVVQHGK